MLTYPHPNYVVILVMLFMKTVFIVSKPNSDILIQHYQLKCSLCWIKLLPMNLGELENSTYNTEQILSLDLIVLLYIPNVNLKENLSIYVKMLKISLLLTGLLKFIPYGYPQDGPLNYLKTRIMMVNPTTLLNLLNVQKMDLDII